MIFQFKCTTDMQQLECEGTHAVIGCLLCILSAIDTVVIYQLLLLLPPSIGCPLVEDW